MQVRTGSGAMQAVQRVVDRGRGAVVEELNDVLTWTRSGLGEAEAFRRAAELTPEPSAARTYQLLAAGVERGVDLGGGLLALERRHPRRAARADAQGRRAPARRDARSDDRDPRPDHVALHRRAASFHRSRTPLTMRRPVNLRNRDESGMTTAELLGNAALGVLALVVIWGLLQTLGVDIVKSLRDALIH